MGSFGRKVTVMNRIRCTAAAEDTQKRKREKKGPQSTYWCQRIDAFKLCFWRTLLGVHWTVRKSNQSILKKINPEYSLEGLMLKLKLQHFGHLMWRADSLEKTLMLGKIEGRRRRGRQEGDTVGGHHQLNGHESEQTPEIVEDRGLWCAAVHGVAKSWTWLSDWTTTTTVMDTCRYTFVQTDIMHDIKSEP